MEKTKMKYLIYITKAFAFLALIHIALPHTVWAYLDPGTGSYFLQLTIASILGGVYAVKLFWKNIKTFIKNIFSRGEKDKKNEAS